MKQFFKLFRAAARLKEIDREGWKRVGIDDPESVADHTFRCVLMGALIGKDLDLDVRKLMMMLLIHDLPEIETGDITPEEKIRETVKRDMEKSALESILKVLSSQDKEDLIGLWEEFERGESEEARVGRDIDRAEMILQALEYQENYLEKDFSEFIVEEEIETESIKNAIKEFKEY